MEADTAENNFEVSILVLVEGILQLTHKDLTDEELEVSILVLVEGILQLQGINSSSNLDAGFNPCFSGRYSAIKFIAWHPNTI